VIKLVAERGEDQTNPIGYHGLACPHNKMAKEGSDGPRLSFAAAPTFALGFNL
jgi:hypothetical protein